VAFLRGDDVLVAVVLRGDPSAVPLAMPDGQWRDVLGGGGHRLGLVLFERA
jgi:hypothetical protein